MGRWTFGARSALSEVLAALDLAPNNPEIWLEAAKVGAVWVGSLACEVSLSLASLGDGEGHEMI